jgi:hypothetical protein
MSKLNEFIANVKMGMAKTSFFSVLLTLPKALSNYEPSRSNMNKILLFCDQAQIPGVSFSTNQVRSYGEFREMAYEKLYEPIQLSFYVDVDMSVKKLFDAWVSIVQNPKTRDFYYPDDYSTDKFDIIVQDSMDSPKYTISLFKAYPKTIAPIQLDYSSKDIMKMQVTMVYQYYEVSQSYNPSSVNSSSMIGIDEQSMLSNDMSIANMDAFSIPDGYFNNFDEFQGEFNNYDFSYGVKSVESIENMGEDLGLGGIFV